MDLGCIDLGCIEKRRNEAFLDSDASMNESTAAKVGKNKASKEAGQSNGSSLKKFTSQIKKPPHRKTSPLNWFPRKKVDSYLKRKIKLLQEEVGGMNLTLDETLGNSNPHYSKVLKEKIAVREAAHKAMEIRKAALVEASWCRILQAARIQSKDAESILLKAEKAASEAFEAAKAIGVIMYDMPDCPHKQYEIENSSVNGGRSTTHAVTASFETAFEVDKQVGAAVKAAFVKLASCPSINKEEFKELLRKISENPDTGEDNDVVSEMSSKCESDTGSELGSGFHKEYLSCDKAITEVRQRKYKKTQLSENSDMTKLVVLMLERLRCLQEDELASLATIVATCGLSAALAEAENNSQPVLSTSASNIKYPRRISSFGVGSKHFNLGAQMRNEQVEAELPSLDKFLVKRLTRLEREVQEAKKSRMNKAKERNEENMDKPNVEKENRVNNISSIEPLPDLGSILAMHSSKLEKEIYEAKRDSLNPCEMSGKKADRMHNGLVRHIKEDVTDVPLDKFLERHVSRLEREVQEEKDKRNFEMTEDNGITLVPQALIREENSQCFDREQVEKENIELNKKEEEEFVSRDSSGELLIQTKENYPALQGGKDESKKIETSLDKILVKPVHRLEREKMHKSSLGLDYGTQHCQKRRQKETIVEHWESFDKILVKHVCRLEKEKIELGSKETLVKVKRREFNSSADRIGEVSLDQILVKHKSRLEKEKVAFAQQSDDQIKHVVSRREARERELQEAWGGLSLGNSIRPHLSRIERDKAAWLKAEEEERREVVEEGV